LLITLGGGGGGSSSTAAALLLLIVLVFLLQLYVLNNTRIAFILVWHYNICQPIFMPSSGS